MRFTKDSIVYSKEYIAPGLPPIFEERRLISDLKEWNKLEFFMPTVEMQSTRPGNEAPQK
ncbi:MAG: hypothetical protein U5L09_08430 [Bacteroidales bacterium]|nr:hypothetical protein [Bacteroidales bacterium]